MRRLIVLLVALSLLGLAPAAVASPLPAKKFSSCKALNKVYPNGVTYSNSSARNAVADGWRKPRVAAGVFQANLQLDREGNGVLCGRRDRAGSNSEPASREREFCEGRFGLDPWNVPEYCDWHLDSYRVQSWCQGAYVIYQEVPSYCRRVF